MNSRILLLGIGIPILFISKPLFAGNPVLWNPVGAEFHYERDVKVVLKSGGSLTGLVYTENGKSVPVPADELKDIFNPLLSNVSFSRTLDAETGKPLAVVTFSFQGEIHPWGETMRTVSFHFVDGAYSRRVVEIPTGEDTWERRTKKVGKPEESDGKGGAIPVSE